MPESSRPDREGPDDDPPETDRERLVVNAVLAVVFVAIVGAGWWIVNAMIDVRLAQDCVASGRRNCAQIEAPAR